MTADRPRTSIFRPMTPQPHARWWELAVERRIHCPVGHHIPARARINETGFVICGGDKGRCGLWVFIFAIRGSGVVVAQVTPDEMEEMRDLQTPTAMLDYLQIFPTRKAG